MSTSVTSAERTRSFARVLGPFIAVVVDEGMFDTFDPEGVGDMSQGFAASLRRNLIQVLDAPDAAAREKAIDDCPKRLTLQGIATDRILGLPDGSTIALDRGQVAAMIARIKP